MKQITAKQYSKIHPHLPVRRGNVRISNITFINAIHFVMENGCNWRALPGRFGNWFTVYARFRRWSRSDVLDRLFAALRNLQTDGDPTSVFLRIFPRQMHSRMVRMPHLSLGAGPIDVAPVYAVDFSPPFDFDYTLCWPYIVADLGPEDERPPNRSASIVWPVASTNAANCAFVTAVSPMRKDLIRFFWGLYA